ncbi:MAG: head GIN domain-containing protein [Flavobacteriaceae bacterium]
MKSFKIQKAIQKLLIISLVLLSGYSFGQLKNTTVKHFDKVIVSPHIAVNFVEGTSESVTVHSSTEPLEKLNIEVVGKTLRLYLEGAKMVTKQEKTSTDKWKKSIYKGTVVTATITYKQLKELSLRGEEKFVCESVLTGPEFKLKLYGESEVYLNEVDLDNLTTSIYGESYLEVKKGAVGKQKITAYGESTINTLEANSIETKITAYGEGSYRVAVSDRLKVTAYGEAVVAYAGSPEVDRGMIIGEAEIQKID